MGNSSFIVYKNTSLNRLLQHPLCKAHRHREQRSHSVGHAAGPAACAREDTAQLHGPADPAPTEGKAAQHRVTQRAGPGACPAQGYWNMGFTPHASPWAISLMFPMLLAQLSHRGPQEIPSDFQPAPGAPSQHNPTKTRPSTARPTPAQTPVFFKMLRTYKRGNPACPQNHDQPHSPATPLKLRGRGVRAPSYTHAHGGRQVCRPRTLYKRAERAALPRGVFLIQRAGLAQPGVVLARLHGL